MRTWQDFDIVSLAFIPLFLFSATFYPLTVFRDGSRPWCGARPFTKEW